VSYPAPIAAALSGTSIRQLTYWRSSARGGPLLRPENSGANRVLYSFRDVVALRTVAYLREEVSLQRIRRAVETLRNLGSREHLSRYRLVAEGGSVVWVTDDAADTAAGGSIWCYGRVRRSWPSSEMFCPRSPTPPA
jgi:DNA-binding transcriptional MerR regulator